MHDENKYNIMKRTYKTIKDHNAKSGNNIIIYGNIMRVNNFN